MLIRKTCKRLFINLRNWKHGHDILHVSDDNSEVSLEENKIFQTLN